MKNYLLFAFIALILGCVQEKPKNDLIRDGLHGPVCRISMSSYFALEKFGEIVRGDKCMDSFNIERDDHSITYYNLKGNRDLKKYYDQSGDFLFKSVYFFIDSSRVQQETRCWSDYSIIDFWIYEYDLMGELLEINIYSADENLKQKVRFSYNEIGDLIERSGYNPDGSILVKYKYDYDELGSLSKEDKYFGEDLNFLLQTTFKYDPLGNITEESYRLNNTNELKMNFTYKFDEFGNWVERVDYFDDEPKYLREREIRYFDYSGVED